MIRLLLTEGHSQTRAALGVGLGALPELLMVGTAGTGAELLALLPSTAPTVVLFDLKLPGPDAFALLPALREQYPQLRVLAHGETTTASEVVRAFHLGAHGYLLKGARFAELVYGLRAVAGGQPFLGSAIGLGLLGRYQASSAAAAPIPRPTLNLSKREIQVLALVAEGLTNAEIGLKLITSKRTIETHRQNIIAKTQTRNTAALIKLAARQGLLPE